MEWLAGVVGLVLVGVAVVPGVRVGVAWRVAAAVWWVSGLVWLVVKLEGLAWGVPVLVGLVMGGLLALVGALVAWLAVRWPWFAGGVGALVVGVGVWWIVGAEDDPGKPAALLANGADAVQTCYCAVGAYCVGPKGGVYCITDDGRKKYQRRGDK